MALVHLVTYTPAYRDYDWLGLSNSWQRVPLEVSTHVSQRRFYTQGRARAVVTGWILGGLVVLFFAIALVRMHG